MPLRFQYDTNFYKAEYEYWGDEYLVTNIQISEITNASFVDHIFYESILIRREKIDGVIQWLTEDDITTDFIKTIGDAIEERDA